MKITLSLSINSGFAVAYGGCGDGYGGYKWYYSSKIVAKKAKTPQPSSPKVESLCILVCNVLKIIT